MRDVFDVNDMQGFAVKGPYESVKRLTDVLSLTTTLPSTKPYSTSFLTIDDPELAKEKPIQPKVYLSHPGIVASTLFPLPWWIMWAYRLSLVFARFFGSPWHTVDSYPGAKATAWLTLQEQATLDEMNAEKVKWGSSSNRHLESRVKKTEVQDWGWEGKPEDAKALSADTEPGVFKKTVGRKKGTADTTEEDIVKFEELGAACWKAMEDLRYQWEGILGKEKA